MDNVQFTVEGFDRLIFNKAKLRQALRAGGADVRAEARRLVARIAVSGPGEFPGRDSGALRNSIQVRVASGGGYVTVAPYRTAEMGGDFYPAYLHYGTEYIAPRKNYMTQALQNRRAQVRGRIQRSLQRAIEAR